MCMIIPTIGIQAIQEVTIPRTLPDELLPSLFAITRVVMCKANITASGVHKKLRTKVPPIIGIPKNASKPPVIHLRILDADMDKPPFSCWIN